MAFKYCSCGNRTTYSVTPPTSCPACKEPYVKNVVPKSSNPLVSRPSVASPAKPAVRPARTMRPSDASVEGQDSDWYDKDEMHALASELAASIRGDIVISAISERGLNLGQIVDNPEAFNHIGNRGPVDDLPAQSLAQPSE